MRRTSLTIAALLGAVLPLAAQQNPFKLLKRAQKSYEVNSTLSGDIRGTSVLASDGARLVRRSSDTTKMMGKTSISEHWQLTTPDSMYNADLVRKTGRSSPNLLPYLASAYDDLDGDGKKRFHQNMADMATMMSRAFNLGQINSGEKLGTKNYAGHDCVERKFGGFTVCQMEDAPVVLHTSGSLLCINYEETATSVKLGSPSNGVFDKPAGITFVSDPYLQRPDSVAKGFVGYLSSQALSDSIAKAKAEMEAAKAKQAQSGQTHQMTPEEQAQMQSACEMIKSVDMGKVMAAAADAWKKALADAAKNEAKNAAVKGLKGLFKKPRIP